MKEFGNYRYGKITDEYIKSNFADIKNVGNRYGGAITAAAFLKNS